MRHKVFGVKEAGKTYFDRPGVYLIASKNKQIAVIRTPKGYFLPGGGIEPEESHMDCLQREALEEIGYTIQVERCLGTGEMYYYHSSIGYFHPIQTYYIGMLDELLMKPVESDHVLEWMDTETATKSLYLMCQRWAVEQFLL